MSMPLAYPSTLDHRPPDALSGMVDVLRGGALEPDARALLRKKSKLKQKLLASVQFQRDALRIFLSQAGPQFDPVLLKLSITFQIRR